MQSFSARFHAARSRPASLAITLGALAVAYFVLLGEAGQYDPPLVLRVVSAAIAGLVILVYILRAPAEADRVDKGTLVALVLFAASATLSAFPRQSLDALLGALLYAAAFFVARSLLEAERGRQAFAICLIALSGLLSVVAAAGWIPRVLEWMALTGWSVTPPLTLPLSAWPWGDRHDLALLVVMLYPSWFIGRITPLRAAAATVIGTLVVLIVLVDGSRTLWLSLLVASVVLGILVGRRFLPSDRRHRAALGALVVGGTAVLALSGVIGLILERSFSAESLELRWAMWGPLVDAWLTKPIAGFGPGSFPWVLQLTDYFQANSLAPRHPDNAVFQVLAEAGLVGLGAMAVLAVTLGPPLVRGRSRAAVWVLLVFVLASLGQNPTDFSFLVAIAILWAAFAIPRSTEPNPAGEAIREPRKLRGPRPLRIATLMLLGVAGLAWTATAVADISYGSTRSAIRQGNLAQAMRALELARDLDPGMALYSRQLGVIALVNGDARAAIDHLEHATAQNPSDDLAWRALAVAYRTSGERGSGWTALEHAIQGQRSDSTNLILAAKWLVEEGDRDEAVALLAEIVQAWPEVVAALGWNDLLPRGIDTPQVVETALDRWTSGLPAPQPRSLQPVTLAVMSGRANLAARLAAEALGPSMGPAYLAVTGCWPDALSMLGEVPDQNRRTSLYWTLVARLSAVQNNLDARAVRVVEIMSAAPFPLAGAEGMVDPLAQSGGGYTADFWGYRRTPVNWPASDLLPSARAGFARWNIAPVDGIRTAGLESTLAACL